MEFVAVVGRLGLCDLLGPEFDGDFRFGGPALGDRGRSGDRRRPAGKPRGLAPGEGRVEKGQFLGGELVQTGAREFFGGERAGDREAFAARRLRAGKLAGPGKQGEEEEAAEHDPLFSVWATRRKHRLDPESSWQTGVSLHFFGGSGPCVTFLS